MEKNNKQYCNISLLITGYSKTGKTIYSVNTQEKL